MIPLRCSKIIHLATMSGILLLAAGAQSAHADPLAISILAPGIQAPTGITTNYETFDTAMPSGGTYTTNFNGSSLTGTYTGNFSILAADAFGGANGSNFISTTGSMGSYTLTLSAPVNYFGMWLSALDSGNTLSFYNGSTLVESLSSADFAGMLGACPSSANLYCGNPNNHLDANEQFAYLNYYDTTGNFNKIVFSENSSSGAQFESDNQAVASLPSDPGGTPGVVPEPASLFLLGSGLLGFAGIFRRQFLL